MRKPKNIIASLQDEINAAVSMLLSDANRQCDRWSFFVTDTRCGRTRYDAENFTVPLWAYKRGLDYFIYYTAHELSHIFCVTKGNYHGPEFMKVFLTICPDHCHHFELEYKPRNAIAAGIKEIK